MTDELINIAYDLIANGAPDETVEETMIDCGCDPKTAYEIRCFAWGLMEG